jgi:hypothetical protein
MNETIRDMERNVILLDTREQNLGFLKHKTTNLTKAARGFRKSSNRVREQSRWKE